MFTAGRGIALPFLLEVVFGPPSVTFMAAEDQQHLVKALMDGYPLPLPSTKSCSSW
jgi:hypothetical protein